MPTARQLDVVIITLAARFPNAFAMYQERRKPLKLGIHNDIAAALGEVEHLSAALAYYTRNIGYLRAQRLGAPRFDLDGQEAGSVNEEQAVNARRSLVALLTKAAERKAKAAAKPELPAPARAGLAVLKEAGKRCRAAA